MRTNIALAAIAFASSAYAHTRVWNLEVNGEDQGDGRTTYIRSPPNNDPVKNLTIPDLACNVDGGTPAPEFVTAAAGDTLTFVWYHDNLNDDIIADSHKGPVITYIAPYTEDDGASAIWSKIDEEGYDGSQWAVDKLIANKGKKEVTIPSSLKAGQYLVRQEVIGLHEADASYTTGRGAQFYPSCAQVEITGDGTATPPQNFDFNEGYTADDPGILFNLYGTFTSYDIPGPKVWDGTGSGTGSGSGSGGNATSSAAPAPTSSATPATSSVAAAEPSSVYSAPSTTAAASATASAVGGGACRRKRHA